MLGYTLPYYNRLSPADNRVYRRYYCEGCHQLRQGFGLTSTLTVNYDMTFNTILLNSIAGDVLEFEGTRRRFCVLDRPKADSDLMRRMAAYTLILVKWELHDDDTDNPSMKSKAASLALRKAIDRAVEAYPEYDRMVEDGFGKLHDLELQGCRDAVLMGRTFGEGLIGPLRDIAGSCASADLDNVFRQLSTVVYIMDAIDDLDEDFKEGTYNPLLPDKGYKNSSDFRLKNVYGLTSMLNAEIGSLQESYSKIRPRMRAGTGICDNIVYLGIPDSAKNVMMGNSTARTSVKNVLSNRKQRMSEGA
jgi:hypothetical protein